MYSLKGACASVFPQSSRKANKCDIHKICLRIMSLKIRLGQLKKKKNPLEYDYVLRGDVTLVVPSETSN